MSSNVCTAWASRSTKKSSVRKSSTAPAASTRLVGSHDTLLAYLVRRLLENGANSSFVNRIADEAVSIDDLVADPTDEARKISPLGAPHPRIELPHAILGARNNSAGLDLQATPDCGSCMLPSMRALGWPGSAAPALGDGEGTGKSVELANPANLHDVVGHAVFADAASIDRAFASAGAAAPGWAKTLPSERASLLLRAADLLQAKLPSLIGLIIREAGKSAQNAIGEASEAVDFLRYYAGCRRAVFPTLPMVPLGTVVRHQPPEFSALSIFTGQLAGALAW